MYQWIARGVVVGVLVLAGLTMASSTEARAADNSGLDKDHAAKIAANCTSALSSLAQLHRSDGLLRVNRGQAYEYIATDLMSHLNSRLVLNKIDAADFVEITADFDEAVEAFRINYKTYEERLSSILRLDCSKNPGIFYNAVNEARSERAKVYQRVKVVDQLMDDYYQEFKDLADNYQQEDEG